MPSIIIVHVYEARDLPVMDKSSKLTDAYVVVEVPGDEEQRTEVTLVL